MDPDPKPKRKKRLPYWAALIIGVVGCGLIANGLTLSLQRGVFTSWHTLPKPPEGVVRIADADEQKVWVATGDGHVFVYTIYCSGDACGQWLPVDSASGITRNELVHVQRGAHCPKEPHENLPMDPPGKMNECVAATFPGPEFGSISYFALMADGAIKAWKIAGSMIESFIYLIVSTIVIPVIVATLISVFYAGMNVGRKQAAADFREAPEPDHDV